LESVGINIQKVQVRPQKEHHTSSPTKRKLDYNNSQFIIEEENYQLTPNILDDSKTYDSKTYDYQSKLDLKNNSKLESPGCINITNHLLRKSPEKIYKNETPNKSQKSEMTPKMIVSVKRINTPSSYSKESPKVSEGEDENEVLTYKDIIEDTETIEFMDKYFEDSQDDIRICKFMHFNSFR
jgi:hypothetical protein